jgi:hypothetical protein
MNVSEKRAIERMIEQRADQAQHERTQPAPVTPPARLVKLVQKAHDAASAEGWNVYVGHGSDTVSLSTAPGNPKAAANREADNATIAAIKTAKDAAIVELWTTDEFDLAAVFASLEAAKS